MAKRSREYWRKRFEELERLMEDKAAESERYIKAEYEKAMLSTQKDIELFYARYAKENSINMVEARKLLDKSELKGFKMSLFEFREKALYNAGGQWDKELSGEYIKSRVSRLEALKSQIRFEVGLLGQKQENALFLLMADTFEEMYYRTAFEASKGLGYQLSFSVLNREAVEKAVYTRWLDGNNFSSRIWKDKEKLLRELNTNLMQGIIRGDNREKMVKGFMERLAASKSHAEGLVQTESAHIMNEASVSSYREFGTDKYEFLGTLDVKTCAVCGAFDKKVFKVSERIIGTNYPPLHTRCRCTTAPDADAVVSARAARDPKTGKTVMVPGDMDFEEWKKHIDGQYGAGTWATEHKKTVRRASDKAQYDRYKKVLGHNGDIGSFDKFQNFKYTDIEGWTRMRRSYADTNRFNKIVETSANLNIKGKVIKDFERVDLKGFKFNYAHINMDRGHKVTKRIAQDYIANAKVAYSRWGGDVVVYVSRDGCSVVNLKNKIVSTAYKSVEYDEKFRKLMEVLDFD